MLDAALAAAEVPQQVRAHDPPTQPRTPRHRIVGVGDVKDALTDQVDDLAVQRRLQRLATSPGSSFFKDGLLARSENAIAASMVSGMVFVPPTTSTRGITCGGLKG